MDALAGGRARRQRRFAVPLRNAFEQGLAHLERPALLSATHRAVALPTDRLPSVGHDELRALPRLGSTVGVESSNIGEHAAGVRRQSCATTNGRQRMPAQCRRRCWRTSARTLESRVWKLAELCVKSCGADVGADGCRRSGAQGAFCDKGKITQRRPRWAIASENRFAPSPR